MYAHSEKLQEKDFKKRLREEDKQKTHNQFCTSDESDNIISDDDNGYDDEDHVK